MDEAEEILLRSLENAGVSLPSGVSSMRDLAAAADALFSVCSQSLRLVDSVSSTTFPDSLPSSMPHRFKICTALAASFNALGYKPLLSFHQFLYPSNEDSHKLVRFLVGRLSQTSRSKQSSNEEIRTRSFLDGTLSTVNHGHLPVPIKTATLRMGNEEGNLCLQAQWIPGTSEGLAVGEVSTSEFSESVKQVKTRREESKEFLDEVDKSTKPTFMKEQSQRNGRYVTEQEQKLASLREQSANIRLKVEDTKKQEKILAERLAEKALEVEHLQSEYALLKAAVEMALNDEHSSEFHIEELNKQVETKRKDLIELESNWKTLKQPFGEKKRNLEQALSEPKSERQENFQELERIELEIKATVSEILKRDEEHSKLSTELKNQPKVASRKSYIERITEITKNSRKQDADIDQILQETRLLQLESNSIQDRLYRTYKVVDETVSRNAKNDPVRQCIHRLLTGLHESFEQISDKILASDRAQREATELETKLAAMTSNSVDIGKLEADLDAIRNENDLFEKQLRQRR